MSDVNLDNVKFKALYDEAEIDKRVKQLGAEITKDLKGEPLVVVSVLKGAFMFTADLVREIKVPVVVDFIGCASYNGTQSTGTKHVAISGVGREH